MTGKIIKKILIAISVVFALIQFIRPPKVSSSDITSDDITRKMFVPEDVHAILKKSCYDCHSNHTKWPWYSHIAPASWLLAYDVNKGRNNMNFSEWGNLSEDDKQSRLTDICDILIDEEMPLKRYLLLHPDAKISDSQRDSLCNWINASYPDHEED